MEIPQGGTFKAVGLPNPTSTISRCFGVIDIGTVDNTFPGQPIKRERKLAILWELPKLLAVFSDDLGEQPFSVMTEIKVSGHPDSNFPS